MGYEFKTVDGELKEYAFDIGGVLALRNFTAVTNGNRLIVQSQENANFTILDALVNEVEIDGVVYDDVVSAQEALQRLVFNPVKPVILTENLKMKILSSLQSNPKGSSTHFYNEKGELVDFSVLYPFPSRNLILNSKGPFDLSNNNKPLSVSVSPEAFNGQNVYVSCQVDMNDVTAPFYREVGLKVQFRYSDVLNGPETGVSIIYATMTDVVVGGVVGVFDTTSLKDKYINSIEVTTLSAGAVKIKNCFIGIGNNDKYLPWFPALEDVSIFDGVHKSYQSHSELFSLQSEQKQKLIYRVDDASNHPLVSSGYAYFEYIGSVGNGWDDYILISKQQIFDNLEYKLLCKTSSQEVDWGIHSINPVQEIEYFIVDNNTGETLKEGVGNIQGDLTSSSGDASVYVKVDSNGLGVTRFVSYYGKGKFTFLNFDVFPDLKKITIYSLSTNITSTVGSLLNLEEVLLYGGSYSDLDFQNIATLKSVIIYSNVVLSNNLDVSSAVNLKKYVSELETSSFDVANHRLIEYLDFKDTTSTMLEVNINNVFLPNLKTLRVGRNNSYPLDLNSRDLSKLEHLYVKCSSLSGMNTMINLKYLSIDCDDVLDVSNLVNLETLSIIRLNNTVLDLKPLVSLKVFKLLYSRYPNLTDILIDNGLNSQITLFCNLYTFSSRIVNVKVDNPVDANSEVSPYLPTVWKKKYNGYDVLNFI